MLTTYAQKTAGIIGLAIASLLFTSDAAGQVTARQLIAGSTKEYGPQFKDVETAIAAFGSGNGAAAFKAFESAKKKNPQLPPAGVMMAQLLFVTGNEKAARAFLEQTIRETPADPEPYAILGDLALRGGRAAEAQILFEKTAALGQSYSQNDFRKNNLLASAEAGQASVAESRSDWKRAIAHLTSWANAAPSLARPHLRLARVHYQLNDEAAALKSFQTAHKLDPTLPLPKINLALLQQQLGKTAAARDTMKKAAAESPKEISAQLAAAAWALDTGDLEFAKNRALAAHELNKESAPAMVIIGIVSRNFGDYELAEKWLEAALIRAPGDSSARNHLALTLIESKSHQDRAKALGYAQLNAQVNNDLRTRAGREATITRAWVENQLGFDELAKTQVQGALSAGGIGPENAYHAAQIFADSGEAFVVELLVKATESQAAFPGKKEAADMLKSLSKKQPTTP